MSCFVFDCLLLLLLLACAVLSVGVHHSLFNMLFVFFCLRVFVVVVFCLPFC